MLLLSYHTNTQTDRPTERPLREKDPTPTVVLIVTVVGSLSPFFIYRNKKEIIMSADDDIKLIRSVAAVVGTRPVTLLSSTGRVLSVGGCVGRRVKGDTVGACDVTIVGAIVFVNSGFSPLK